MPLRPCPRCGRLAPNGLCPQHPRNRGGYRPHRPSHATYRDPWYRTLRAAILTNAHHRCAYCNQPAGTADHVIPHSRGGTHTLTNLVAACRTCNTSKGDRTLTEWVATGLAPAGAAVLLTVRTREGLPS